MQSRSGVVIAHALNSITVFNQYPGETAGHGSQVIVDIACCHSSSPMPQTFKEIIYHDETPPSAPGETGLAR